MLNLSLSNPVDNLQSWCDASSAGDYRVPRRELAMWLGARCWSLYRNLALSRDRHGFVRYRASTLAEKMSHEWGRDPKPISERTVKRYLTRLHEVGLIVTTPCRTSGGCRIRRVYGKPCANTEYMGVPEYTHRLLRGGHLPKSYKWAPKNKPSSFATSEVESPLGGVAEACKPIEVSVRSITTSRMGGPWVSRRVSRCAKTQNLLYGEIRRGDIVSRPVRGSHVGAVCSGVLAFPKEGKAPPQVGDADFDFLKTNDTNVHAPNLTPSCDMSPPAQATTPSLSGGAKSAPSDLTTPESLPPHPISVTGHYTPPAMPKVEKHDPAPVRVRKLITGYRAAMAHHTGKGNAWGARGIPQGSERLLLAAASRLEAHGLSPHLWCVAMMAYQRDDAKRSNRTWKPPSIREIYAPAMIDKLRGMVRALKGSWAPPAWWPDRCTDLCTRWEECRRELRRVACNPGARQQDLDAIAARYFPPGFFMAECELIRQEMLRKFTSDAQRMRQGRPIW